MASSTNTFLSLLPLFLLLSCSSPKTLARQTKFFTENVVEVKPRTNLETPVPSPEYGPLGSPEPAPATSPVTSPAPTETETGYGLYSHDPEKETETATPTTETGTSYGSDDNKFEDEMLSEKSNTDESTRTNEYTNNNNNNSNNNNNRYADSTYEYTPTSDNTKYERQGMSDTRFVENGKYYYDVGRTGKSQSMYGREEEEEAAGSSYENESSRYEPSNYSSKYEFDTMEEYYKSHGYNEKNPEEYVP